MLLVDFENDVDKWVSWVNEQTESNRRYDIALFKIWITFEKYLSDLIVAYSCGIPSELSYVPNLKLRFCDESHFNIFFSRSKRYVDYISVIEEYSNHIFTENPFQILLSSTSYSQCFEDIKIIRNYVAHESSEARSKYIKRFCNNDAASFVEPNELLIKFNKHHSCTNFSFYINNLKEIARYISNPYF